MELIVRFKPVRYPDHKSRFMEIYVELDVVDL